MTNNSTLLNSVDTTSNTLAGILEALHLARTPVPDPYTSSPKLKFHDDPVVLSCASWRIGNAGGGLWTDLDDIKNITNPEFMFAIIAAYLPKYEGSDLRRVAGSIVFRHEDLDGKTYKNGVLHSYNDKPAVIDAHSQEWYKNGVRYIPF